LFQECVAHGTPFLSSNTLIACFMPSGGVQIKKNFLSGIDHQNVNHSCKTLLVKQSFTKNV